jgi:hypothetical protein
MLQSRPEDRGTVYLFFHPGHSWILAAVRLTVTRQLARLDLELPPPVLPPSNYFLMIPALSASRRICFLCGTS